MSAQCFCGVYREYEKYLVIISIAQNLLDKLNKKPMITAYNQHLYDFTDNPENSAFELKWNKYIVGKNYLYLDCSLFSKV